MHPTANAPGIVVSPSSQPGSAPLRVVRDRRPSRPPNRHERRAAAAEARRDKKKADKAKRVTYLGRSAPVDLVVTRKGPDGEKLVDRLEGVSLETYVEHGPGPAEAGYVVGVDLAHAPGDEGGSGPGELTGAPVWNDGSAPEPFSPDGDLALDYLDR